MWDRLGLEVLFDVTEELKKLDDWEKNKIVSLLKEENLPKKPRGIPLEMLLIRARVNSQRQYEIYEFTSTLSFNEIKHEFETNPQPIVDWVRKNGGKVYSDYVKPHEWVIQ